MFGTLSRVYIRFLPQDMRFFFRFVRWLFSGRLDGFITLGSDAKPSGKPVASITRDRVRAVIYTMSDPRQQGRRRPVRCISLELHQPVRDTWLPLVRMDESRIPLLQAVLADVEHVLTTDW